jgi:hypothetical protein
MSRAGYPCLKTPPPARIMAACMTKTPLLFALLAALALGACNSTNSGSTASDPYASNYNDGHYNPYPGQSGRVDSSAPTYTQPPDPQAPAPQPPANPYAFDAPKPAPSTSAASTSSSRPKSSTKSKSKSTASKSKSKSSSGSRYTVGKGDTLYGIALKKKTTIAKLKAANGLKNDLIRPGQSLKIP